MEWWVALALLLAAVALAVAIDSARARDETVAAAKLAHGHCIEARPQASASCSCWHSGSARSPLLPGRSARSSVMSSTSSGKEPAALLRDVEAAVALAVV